MIFSFLFLRQKIFRVPALIRNKSLLIMGILVAMLLLPTVGMNAKTTHSIVRAATKYVTITNPQDGETVSGVVTITVDASSTPTIYIDGVRVARAYTYDWDTTQYSDGFHTIKAVVANVYDEITVIVDNGGGEGGDTGGGETGGGEGDGVVTRYAIIVGISDYKAISDLSYCDEDASDWYNFLNSLGWDYLVVLGDSHPENYPKYDGLATEYNVKQALLDMVQSADADDIIAFISSGHGSGDRRGNSYLCMWDCSAGENGEDGNLWDYELADILDDAVATRIFVFLDHCFSGGFGDDLMNMPNSEHVYLTTTCTEKGYGYDDPEHENGLWTYYFLEYSWIGYYGGDPTVPLEDVFAYAHDAYPRAGVDEPQEFDGDPTTPFVVG